MSNIKKLKKAPSSREFEFSDTFSDAAKKIVRTRYYIGGDVAIAIAELNRPNHWDDEFFDAACNHLVAAWNEYLHPTLPEEGS